MGTADNRAAALTEYYKRGQYIPGLKVNGMDALAVKAAVQYGKEWSLADNGPLVLEYVTYRYGGHSMSDPGTTYRVSFLQTPNPKPLFFFPFRTPPLLLIPSSHKTPTKSISPHTTQTREEIQRMRSTNDPITGLKQKLLDWQIVTEDEIKQIDKEARAHVDEEVAEAEKMAPPDPLPKVLFEDIYVRGSEPNLLRGRIPEENFYYDEAKA